MNGTLEEREPHPAAHDALRYVKSLGVTKLHIYLESFSSVALEGHNRSAEICGETLRRVIEGEPISDRYLLGLAWTLKNMEEMEDGQDEADDE